MKILKWISHNLLFLYTIFLLVFIPLYPKIPLIGVNRTFVYIRLDDFAIAAGVALYLLQLLRRKAHLKTPLTVAIILFWLIGGLATLNGVIFIFPNLLGVFPHLAFLEWARRVEYLSVFFIAYSAIKDKKYIHFYVGSIAATLLAVVGYGIGQRFLGWPAFLTMNEQFAKGIPLKLSALDRIPSTFAGHYDLAAYLVMIIVLLGSMVIGYKKWYVKVALFISASLGLVLMMMTESRVSFVAYLIAIVFMLIIQKKKWFIIPVLILSILLLHEFSGLSARFGATLSQANVVVDARTGKAIGIAQNETDNSGKTKVVINDIQQTGENLPQGSGFINLPSNTSGTTNEIIKRTAVNNGKKNAEINVRGDFAIKKVFAYDVSFTTRFQGEWPRAIEAFKRNLLFGSGYSSISLATDGDYLRMLGETGILGLAAFLFIFLIAGIYVYRILPQIEDRVASSFVAGVAAGMVGIALNAVLIDVFAASKDAYIMWILIGLSMGILMLYAKKKVHIVDELKHVLTTPVALILYILVLAFGFYLMTTSNYFVADDFVWLHSLSDCRLGEITCNNTSVTIVNFFTHSPNFFYRPLTDLYFYTTYAIFGLNNIFYHVMSIIMLFISGASIFLICQSIFRKKYFAFVAAVAFMVISGHYEAIFWISAVGHLAAATLTLAGLASYVYWKEHKNILFFVLSLVCVVLAPFFHEFGIIAPLFIVAYDLIWYSKKDAGKYISRWYNYLYIIIIPLYLSAKYFSGSWWSHGDYAYNAAKLPFNVIGNLFGYISLLAIGTQSLPYISTLRGFGRENLMLMFVLTLILIAVIAAAVVMLRRSKPGKSIRILILTAVLFVVALLPFLGLGIITSRYSYLAAFPFVLFLTFLLETAYQKILTAKKTLAVAFVVIVPVIFIIYHVSELVRINRDWSEAGKITNFLLFDFSNAYNNPNIGDILPTNDTFYFINVPKTYGQAWVFPVGLKDALYFPLQNKNLTVIETNNQNQALDASEHVANGKVFEFQKDGRVEQIIKTKINTKKE